MRANLRYHLLAMTLVLMPKAWGLECAVCLPSDTSAPIARKIRNMFNQTKLIRCNDLNNSSVQFLIKTCPKNHFSCHIQRTEKWTARTCSKISADQCQMANNVEYCYCTHDHCNVPNNLIIESEQTSITNNQTEERDETTYQKEPIRSISIALVTNNYPFSILIHLTLLLYNLM